MRSVPLLLAQSAVREDVDQAGAQIRHRLLAARERRRVRRGRVREVPPGLHQGRRQARPAGRQDQDQARACVVPREALRFLAHCIFFCARAEDNKLSVTSSIPLSKRYIKYLTKRFLKKNTMRDWIRYACPSAILEGSVLLTLCAASLRRPRTPTSSASSTSRT